MAYDNRQRDRSSRGGYQGPRIKPVIISAEETDKKGEVKIKAKLINLFSGEKEIRFELDNGFLPNSVMMTKNKEADFVFKIPDGVTSGRIKVSLVENQSARDEITVNFSKLGKKSQGEKKESKLKVSIQRGPMLVITAKTPEPKQKFTIASGAPLHIEYVACGEQKHGVCGDNFFGFETGEEGVIQIVVKFKGEKVPCTFTFENETQQIPLIK